MSDDRCRFEDYFTDPSLQVRVRVRPELTRVLGERCEELSMVVTAEPSRQSVAAEIVQCEVENHSLQVVGKLASVPSSSTYTVLLHARGTNHDSPGRALEVFRGDRLDAFDTELPAEALRVSRVRYGLGLHVAAGMGFENTEVDRALTGEVGGALNFDTMFMQTKLPILWLGMSVRTQYNVTRDWIERRSDVFEAEQRSDFRAILAARADLVLSIKERRFVWSLFAGPGAERRARTSQIRPVGLLGFGVGLDFRRFPRWGAFYTNELILNPRQSQIRNFDPGGVFPLSQTRGPKGRALLGFRWNFTFDPF